MRKRRCSSAERDLGMSAGGSEALHVGAYADIDLVLLVRVHLAVVVSRVPHECSCNLSCSTRRSSEVVLCYFETECSGSDRGGICSEFQRCYSNQCDSTRSSAASNASRCRHW